MLKDYQKYLFVSFERNFLIYNFYKTLKLIL